MKKESNAYQKLTTMKKKLIFDSFKRCDENETLLQFYEVNQLIMAVIF